ncbi:23S rRNA (adenine(2030)-N(6))-methyltransferase RlmJ [Lutimaribacter sp. EGI FJ00015]|uniref:23S rRNA (Adenine(2030)-N(6))-methyltransferase RlmJ n=1 Tax=Lutimaribacter degradans TaxID=2945989 RepID=A0ACC6A1P8_9RHOB|nr:23S rRNA (adenine(2030)-N(6))-methyltransferase RlmJ [Lutimaribacter sp. EGI FJ00013]MCM2563534.1 23S rRNA (adenine(2030)-N(6))-methyltransferase RlmJ [Lutimaribacter sp. EGI FJ00013]MCO0614714.1 23S rRNA (adenine(2030)-N(6))-methyltransferase RlmJ [Lutimaribacter sp. EGI FJ00015]MCO0637384.1 23S rRNA (adenine(2030)-N(6))-methyltransferase RlmJ [Lutimaribacter sp. EGI FJ00014]
MLSYQHIYHAGNPADVHKHTALAAMLAYMTRKDKPLSYIETHGGRGLYQLDSAEAHKTGEAAAGIDAVEAARALAGSPYRKSLADVRAAHGPRAYPGSPLIAARFLRPGDAGHVAELHPQEHDALQQALAGTGLRVHRQDGFEMAQAICPPTPRRGLMLIDPSYEVKAEYGTIPGQVAKLHRKWNVGVIALWYPVLTGGVHGPMLAALEAQGLPGVLRHEIRFPPVRAGHRMVGSGVFVVNAPWGLAEALTEVARFYQG